jgi:TM2 domain-containing membrane protein YozV
MSIAKPVSAAIPPNDTHSILVGYLCWIFGFFGAHRFYYGKRKTGLLWFFTLGLLGVGWLIDFFLIPSMDRQADHRYVAGPINYTVAWLLLVCPLIGLLGIHRFYMGKWVTGLLFLVTGSLFGVGWLYDLWSLNEQVSAINAEYRAATPVV